MKEMIVRKEMYITITGTNHYYGMKPFAVGKKLCCIKEPCNVHDSEAIKVVMRDIGKVGYLGNSPYTVATGTMSAGRIYDKVGKRFFVQVMFITASKVICRVLEGCEIPDYCRDSWQTDEEPCERYYASDAYEDDECEDEDIVRF